MIGGMNLEIFTLLIRIGLTSILVTSAFSKFKDMSGHEESIRNYEIVPDRFVRRLGRLNVWTELILGLLILLGIFYKTSIILFLLLMSAYTTAIIVNLLRGRTDLSCGCGGIVGENLISWKLVVRNAVILTSAFLLLSVDGQIGLFDAIREGASFGEVYPNWFFIASSFMWVALICGFALRELITLTYHFKRLLT